MGSNRIRTLPRTRKWTQIVELVAGGAGAAQLATATSYALAQGLGSAASDAGAVESVRLILRLPLAARADDYPGALGQCGLDVSEPPGLMGLVAAVSDAIDAKLPNCHGRTDLGEMAQIAAVEILSRVVGTRVGNLFGTAPSDVQRELAALATVKEFGLFAKQYFSRFTFKWLNYVLSMTLPDHIGDGKRFRTVADQVRFTDALELHCREATIVLMAYSGEWPDKERLRVVADVTREHAQTFLGGAMAKLLEELRHREDTRAN